MMRVPIRNSLIKNTTSRTYGKIVIVLLCAFITILIVQRAWLSDDAYITFRTVDNVLNGFHLDWNSDERVQAFTHPLWMFTLSILTYIFHNIYLTSIFSSVFFTLSAICLYAFSLSKHFYLVISGLLILAFSNAFIDYSTSGLENSLLYLMIAMFSWVFLRGYPNRKNYYLIIFITSFFASLIALTRLDAVLFIIPALVYLLIESKFKGLPYILLGSIPFILWECFSIIYYGFPFPNTFYAKLDSGIPMIEYLQRGIAYYLNIVMQDPLTIIAIFGILLLSLKFSTLKNKLLSMGVFLYLLYIIRIGGDFMQGRFFAEPLFFSVIILSQMKISISRLWLKIVPIALIVTLGLFANVPTYLVETNKPALGVNRINDERRHYYPYTGLFRNNQFNTDIGVNNSIVSNTQNATPNDFILGGLEAKGKPGVVWTKRNIGFFGYLAGRQAYIIDIHGLSDPLLARLPAILRPAWRVGMFDKAIPRGYRESIYQDQNLIEDPLLAEYYRNLLLITHGELFTKERWVAIYKMNFGKLDYLIDEHKYKYYYVEKVNADSILCSKNSPQYSTDNIYGLELDFSSIQYSNEINITLSGNDNYVVNVLNDNQQIESRTFILDSDNINNKIVVNIDLDSKTRQIGFNKIMIIPFGYSDNQVDYGCITLK